MNDPFEARVAAWLRDTARPEPEEVQRLFAFAGALPRRRSTRPIWLAEVGATAVLVTIAAVVAIDRLPFAPRPNGTPSYPIVSDDPRFAKCGGSPNRVIAAFPMQHAADYHAYIPRMGLAPELETPAPAFVVVFDQTHQWGLLPAPQPLASGFFPLPTNAPNEFDVCVWVGDLANGDFVSYSGVEIAGMRTTLPGASLIVFPPARHTPVGSCAAEAWPKTAMSCDAAFAVGNRAGSHINRARIWLTTLSAVTTALHPLRTIRIAPDTEAWVIAFDGSSRCCPVREGSDLSPSPEITSTRWIVAIDATGRLPGFVYYLDWSGEPVPAQFPAIAP